jgi:hypothetical protein
MGGYDAIICDNNFKRGTSNQNREDLSNHPRIINPE